MPMIADGIGISMDKLRIVQNHTGGTFGYKFSPTNEALLGVAALVTQHPVSLVFNQFQNITYTGKRSPAFLHIKLAADNTGKLKALWGNNYVDHGEIFFIRHMMRRVLMLFCRNAVSSFQAEYRRPLQKHIA